MDKRPIAERAGRRWSERITAWQRQDRRFLPLRRHFREQQCVVEGIDDAGKRDAAFLAFDAVALESASVDPGSAASIEHQLRGALRAPNEVSGLEGVRSLCTHGWFAIALIELHTRSGDSSIPDAWK